MSTFMFVFACADVWCVWQCYLFRASRSENLLVPCL